jgi:hypothetical protein
MSLNLRRGLLVRPRPIFGLGLVVSAILCHAHAFAQYGPQPPCENEPVPPIPALGDPAVVKPWSRADLGRDWKPPACTGWAAPGFTTLVTTAARLRQTSEAAGLLRRVGAISELAGMRYWSATHRQWQKLIVDAWALTGLQNGQRRGDFMPVEMKPGAILYYRQTDNLSGTTIYRMHIAEATADRIVYDVQNASIIRYLLIPFFHPGEMQTVCFLTREPENVWSYFSIVRTGKNVSLIAANEPSTINRAVAFYRWLAGIPTDQEPPAAR